MKPRRAAALACPREALPDVATCCIAFMRISRIDDDAASSCHAGFKALHQGIWKRVPDEVEGTIAQWIAKVIFYLLSLLIWYVLGLIK